MPDVDLLPHTGKNSTFTHPRPESAVLTRAAQDD
jgi:hypothetical protein